MEYNALATVPSRFAGYTGPRKPAPRLVWGEMLPKHVDFREKCVCIRPAGPKDRRRTSLHSHYGTAIRTELLGAVAQRRHRAPHGVRRSYGSYRTPRGPAGG